MAAQDQARGEPITAINITPLVDVMLVLLVIFMVTARIAGQSGSVPLDLPEAQSGEAVQRVLAVTIEDDGMVRVDGEAIADDAAFRAMVRQRHARAPQMRTVIAADERAHHGEIVHVLDLLRRSGVVKVAFAVEPAR